MVLPGQDLSKMSISVQLNTGTKKPFQLKWFFYFLDMSQADESLTKLLKKSFCFLFLKYRGQINCFFLQIVKNSFSLAQHFKRHGMSRFQVHSFEMGLLTQKTIAFN